MNKNVIYGANPSRSVFYQNFTNSSSYLSAKGPSVHMPQISPLGISIWGAIRASTLDFCMLGDIFRQFRKFQIWRQVRSAALRKQYFDKNDVKTSTNSKKCGVKFGKQDGGCVRSPGGVMPTVDWLAGWLLPTSCCWPLAADG